MQSEPGDTGPTLAPDGYYGKVLEVVDRPHGITGTDFAARQAVQTKFVTNKALHCPQGGEYEGVAWHSSIVPNPAFNRADITSINQGPAGFRNNYGSSSYVMNADGNGIGLLTEGQVLAGVQTSADYHKPMFRHFASGFHDEYLSKSPAGVLSNRGDGLANFALEDNHVETVEVNDYVDTIADNKLVLKDIDEAKTGW